MTLTATLPGTQPKYGTLRVKTNDLDFLEFTVDLEAYPTGWGEDTGDTGGGDTGGGDTGSDTGGGDTGGSDTGTDTDPIIKQFSGTDTGTGTISRLNIKKQFIHRC